MSLPPDFDNLQYLFLPDVSTFFKDMAGTTPATADGDAIALWLDQSGNNNHLAQPTLANRPILRLNQFNGFPAVQFNGTSHFFYLSNSLLRPARTDYAVISIPDTGVHTLTCGLSSSLQWRMDGQKQRFVSASVLDIGFGTNLMPLNTFTQINSSWDLSTGIFRMAGTAGGSVSGTNVGLGAERWLGVNDVPTLSELFKGLWLPRLSYAVVHSLAMKQSVEAWITSTYGPGI